MIVILFLTDNNLCKSAKDQPTVSHLRTHVYKTEEKKLQTNMRWSLKHDECLQPQPQTRDLTGQRPFNLYDKQIIKSSLTKHF